MAVMLIQPAYNGVIRIYGKRLVGRDFIRLRIDIPGLKVTAIAISQKQVAPVDINGIGKCRQQLVGKLVKV